jgi:hypothetical protein
MTEPNISEPDYQIPWQLTASLAVEEIHRDITWGVASITEGDPEGTE